MHTHIDASESTFQLLTGLPFSQKLPGTQIKECTLACQVILVALSNPVDDSDYSACAHRVTKYLILILQCLVTADPVSSSYLLSSKLIQHITVLSANCFTKSYFLPCVFIAEPQRRTLISRQGGERLPAFNHLMWFS
jgi:hypothetical protein